MNTREQLEMAAKACGYFVRIDLIYDAGLIIDEGLIWNPARNQVDSDRMGSKLRLDVAWDKDGVAACYEWFKNHNGDENAALIAARLRCAAEIGRGMP